MSKDNFYTLLGFVMPLGICILFAFAVYKLIDSRPTTYCTKWVKAVSIEPTNSDNGKYSDEQYIVKYEDGSISGQAQGDIPFARCTSTVRTNHSKAKSEWKIVSRGGEVEWNRGNE